MKNILLISVLIFNTSCLFANPKYPEAKVIVKVQDDDGNLLKDANVRIGFQPSAGFNNWHVKGKTNAKGIFEATNKTGEGIPIRVEKSGYYRSTGVKRDKRTINRLLNRWEPWPSIAVATLRKKKNSVPMYAKKTGPIAVPVIGKPVRYDLEKGDWVKPHGKGEISDLVFTANIKEDDHGNKYQSYTLTFSNKLDGIQEYKDKKYIQSYFKWPYEAPLTNYNPSNYELIVYGINKFPVRKKCKLKENTNYIFRTRTKVDKNGEIISANYGKILNGFDFGGKNFTISFTYYFNPDPKSMSLEFDPAKNLFKFSAKEWEHEVKAP